MLGVITLLPALIAIILAILTKRILISVFIGILLGSFILTGSLYPSAKTSVEYLVNVIADIDNTIIMLFLLTFGGFVGVLEAVGGLETFGKWISKKVKSKRGIIASTWLLGLATFLDCCYHNLITGTVMRKVFDKFKMSREKMAYIIDSTSPPWVVLVPITTFTGFIVGVLSKSFTAVGITQDAFTVYLQTIPLNFYAIIATLLALIIPMFKDFGKTIAPKQEHKHMDHCCEITSKGNLYDFIIPILTVTLVVLLLFISGEGFMFSMLLAILSGIGVSALLFIPRKLISLNEFSKHFKSGVMMFLTPIAMLWLTWALAEISTDIGMTSFIIDFIQDVGLPGYLLPLTIFLVGCFVSYMLGTSWGTWALLMPIAIPLAVGTNAPFILTIAAVLSGGIFGDQCSPLSETTVTAASGAGCEIIDHANTQMPYGLLGLVIAAGLFLIFGMVL